MRSMAPTRTITVTRSVIPNISQPRPAAAGTTHTRLARAMRARATRAPRGVEAPLRAGLPSVGGRCRRSCARTCRAAAARSSRSRAMRAVTCSAAASVMPSSFGAVTRRRTSTQATCRARIARHQEESGPAPRPDHGCGIPASTVTGHSSTISTGGSMSTAVTRVAISCWNACSVRKRRGWRSARSRGASGVSARLSSVAAAGSTRKAVPRPVLVKPRPSIAARR